MIYIVIFILQKYVYEKSIRKKTKIKINIDI